MSPTEWVNMGGQFCDGGDCSICRQSEWSLSNYLGQEKTNDVFKQREQFIDTPFCCWVISQSSFIDWQATLTSADVAGIVAAKLNTVRLPVGFWIIEDIVDRDLEPYAQGGLDELVCSFQTLAFFLLSTCRYVASTCSKMQGDANLVNLRL
jgi:hypothetical protein